MIPLLVLEKIMTSPISFTHFSLEYFQQINSTFSEQSLQKYSIVLSKVEDSDLSSHFFEFSNFGADEQSDLAQLSNSLLSVNKCPSFESLRAKYFDQYLKNENSFFSFLTVKANKQDLLEHFKNEVFSHSNTLKDQSMMFNLIKGDILRVKRSIQDALILLKEIIRYLIEQSVITVEEASMHPILSARLVSLQNSLLVVDQISNSVDMAILSIQKEIELTDNFTSVVYPALSLKHMINVFGPATNNKEIQKTTDQEIVSFFKK